jgi:hypothetical protein
VREEEWTDLAFFLCWWPCTCRERERERESANSVDIYSASLELCSMLF